MDDMTVTATLVGKELEFILSGMDFKTKLEIIKRVLFKNQLKVYLTEQTVNDLSELLKRAE